MVELRKKFKMKSVEKKSLKVQIVKGMLLLLIPIIMLLIYYNVYSIYTYNKELKISNETVLKMYSEELEQTLKRTDVFLSTIVANDNNFALLRNKNKDLRTHLAMYNIETKFDGLLSSEKSLSGLIAYSGPNNAFRIKTSGDIIGYLDKEQIRSFFLNYIANGDNYASDYWFCFNINKQDYIMHIVGKDSTYVAAFVKLSQISKPNFERLDGKYEIVMCNTEGVVLYNNEFMKKQDLTIKVKEEGELTLFSTKYTLVTEKIVDTSMYMCLLIPKLSGLNSVRLIQAILLTISVLTIALIPVSLSYIKKKVTNPLDLLTEVMVNIKAGNLETRVEGSYTTKEFQDVNDTFNDMMTQIKNLKIMAYERELNKQKAQLQYFQLQLKPHFYLNCLKNIYGMAQSEKYEKIQEIIIAISNYLRYMFQDNSKLVSLGEELKFINNYIEIQSIGSSLPPKCVMDVETETFVTYVPLLCILTFIENSIKYGKPEGLQLVVKLKIHMLKTEEGEFIDIVIEDNGKGYDESVLKSIHKHMDEVYAAKNVGIHNIISRLKLLYGKKAEFVIANTTEGAYSELIIPVTTKAEMYSTQENELLSDETGGGNHEYFNN